jgi:hypothetical protein
LFMSAAPPTAALPNDPDPPADPAVVPPADPAANRAPAQSCAARVLSLLRKFIDYGMATHARCRLTRPRDTVH